jgi:hypothetical protein
MAKCSNQTCTLFRVFVGLVRGIGAWHALPLSTSSVAKHSAGQPRIGLNYLSDTPHPLDCIDAFRPSRIGKKLTEIVGASWSDGEVAENNGGHNGALGNDERAFVVIYPASCAEQDDETVAKMGHPILLWADLGHPPLFPFPFGRFFSARCRSFLRIASTFPLCLFGSETS